MASLRRRRSAIDLGQGQAGDVSTGGVAGNDYIANNLADIPEGLARVLADSHEHGKLMVASLEQLRTQFQRGLEHVRGDLDLYRVTEASERAARRREWDAQVKEIAQRADAAALAAERAAQRTELLATRVAFGLGALGVLLLLVALVVGALVYDRLAVLAGLTLGSLLASRLGR